MKTGRIGANWRVRRAGLVLWLLLWARPAGATDVAFWDEYAPDKFDAEHTHLLLPLNAQPWKALTGPVERIDSIGKPALEASGRHGAALKLDGASGLRCVMRETYPGGQISMEAWVRLDRYPDKLGYVLYRRSEVDRDARFNPAVDLSKGFWLAVDREGGLHMEVTNVFYGYATRTSSKPGAVPAGRWVHVAAVCGPGRKLYVDGHLVAEQTIAWGQGLDVNGEKESRRQDICVGCDDQGSSGLPGLVDQVRVHRNVQAFWPAEDLGWTDAQAARPVAQGEPHFVPRHAPAAVVGLDGSALSTGPAGAKVELGKGAFRPGVRGQAYAGRIAVSAPGIFQSREGSLEFWMRPIGVNSLSDRNRTFLGEPFIFYLYNGGTHEPALFFADPEMGNHFVHTQIVLHPGRWFHFLMTWLDSDIRVYMDGRPAGRTVGRPLVHWGHAKADRFVFNGHETVAAIDEVRVYDRALLEAEALNACLRYRDPEKMVPGVSLPAVEVLGEHLPSLRKIAYTLVPRLEAGEVGAVTLELRDGAGKTLKAWPGDWPARTGGEIDLPALGDGEYTLAALARTKAGATVPGGAFSFYRRAFEWEGNRLGVTEKVYPPFEPVTVRDREVRVVGRTMTMNAFGLWDQVRAAGQDLLAGPIRLRYELAGGEGAWQAEECRAAESLPSRVTFHAQARAEALCVQARSSVEVDGCMKVWLTLQPGARPAEIRRLWLEVPLKDALCPLMHAIADGLRHNHAGAVPAGQGTVWEGRHARRSEPWRNDFVPYVWLGSAARGLAVFAENDRGWATAKRQARDKPLAPTHELVREGGRLVLKLHLVNVPTMLEGPREIVLGLQASPTKPMPSDWRRRLPHAPGGLAVVPWGGIQCASQGPYADDWTIVEKVLEARQGRKFDQEWMKAYAAAHNPPKVHNESDWTYYLQHFASRAADVGMARPIAVYQEEMRAAHSRPEWIVYQDEWKTQDGPAARTSGRGLDLRGGHRSFCGISEITFVGSYADFGVYMADQWMRRGVSLYWDNTYLYPSYNTRTTAAYRTPSGHVQPALTIWAVREYHKRVWQAMQERQAQRKEPLEWTLHMTNTLVLPVHTWGTVNLDHELNAKRPFSPEWLQAETVGRQVGNLPLSLYAVAGSENEVVQALAPARRERVEWGLRAVHEIQRHGPQEKLLADFGYAGSDVRVHNYWDDAPVVRVEPGAVKWLALGKPARGEALLVLASWSEQPVKASVTLDRAALGLQGLRVSDAETGQTLGEAGGGAVQVDIDGPWGNRVLRVGK